MCANGLSDAEIAAALGIATRTVRFHFDSSKRKLRARSRVHAVSLVLDSSESKVSKTDCASDDVGEAARYVSLSVELRAIADAATDGSMAQSFQHIAEKYERVAALLKSVMLERQKLKLRADAKTRV